ncbi:hypothetical protein KI387_022944, partial [Taxus chinensis]
MHPQIRVSPSRYVYQNRLCDSESVTRRPDEVYCKDSLLKPFCLFCNVTHGRGSHRGGSVSYQSCAAKGMAPKARLATYKVCWMSGCYDSDILPAFDTAVED